MLPNIEGALTVTGEEVDSLVANPCLDFRLNGVGKLGDGVSGESSRDEGIEGARAVAGNGGDNVVEGVLEAGKMVGESGEVWVVGEYCIRLSVKLEELCIFWLKLKELSKNLIQAEKEQDAASTKSLAFDGCFITLYNVELDTNNRTHLTLSQDVKRAVPTSWNPAALAEFIQKYGTHIVVGIKMGGMDVVHIKQLKTSDAGPNEMETLLQQLANERFSEDLNRSSNGKTVKISGKLQDDQYMPCPGNSI
ncbi:MACPF domain-containing protein [Arachis hypogaea]|nr:MACPF domain-containing protein [Arachis hypogaea]